MKKLLLALLLFLDIQGIVQAQFGPIKNLRYQDDFSDLKSDSIQAKGTDKLKFIPIGKNITLSFGGEIREWYELRVNSNFGDLPPEFIEDKNGVIQHRIMLHADAWFGERFRVFSQLNNTNEFGSPNEPISEIVVDGLGLHQLFGEFHFDVKDSSHSTFVRLGRQEFDFGNGLLISSREGPNNRLAFDAASFIYNNKKFDLHLFGGTPVIINPEVFDNTRIEEYLWGSYLNARKQKDIKLDLYYFGFKSERRSFNWVNGEQTRHTVGTRAWHYSPTFRLEAESMYQFGKFNDLKINAFNFSAELAYVFDKVFLKPSIGLAGSYITGDQNNSDNELNTFDPLYPKPLFGFAAPLGPSNITNIRPIVGLQPVKGMMMNASVYFLSRQSIEDGNYSPGVQQVRPFPEFESDAKSIGTQYALDIFYVPNPHLTFLSFMSYLEPGDYVTETGNGKSSFFVSLSAAYKF
ncbi:alginate export family protein [Sediminitomix flava]|uniref:Alginate export protein n=1 Tax=Sediminitomix flava TaxID=379075 RepID=A0A315ZFH2_SEDFL|nr:alginate export family protein [Sediminitomix flava]PWJ44315.1 alginate export protein [Sediminitomix flava]